ncbi:RpiR family transcriptional regulator [Streptohalobacillus salinus]|uniref:RpiR family transcriptional regulator n=1 Tax=Streptohalobacillus salinus TaxID=621096 RepID=A0A2V3WG52_9BACI|nr:MurR/RpiR family transcriptional regulator [Streptohalobacillus salinus]PXW92233.1 RpiR family transcriptional regulator [Streptohalobacillus salinus]
MYFYDRLKENQQCLNETEQQILDDLLAHVKTIKQVTVREIAEKHFTAPNTIIRLCQKLGFKGFSDFKEALFLTEQTKSDFIEITSLDEAIIKTKQLVNTAVIEQIVARIHEADKIVFFAVGLSRLPAQELDTRLQLLGKNSKIFLDPHVMKHNASLLTTADLAIAISMSGTTESIIEATTIANVSGATTVSITGFSTNALAKLTDFQLYGFTNKVTISGVDAADRFSLHYLINVLFNQYLTTYHSQ